MQWDNFDNTALELDKFAPLFESKTVLRREPKTASMTVISRSANGWVTISTAIESGLGDYQAGEGIIGIPYALTKREFLSSGDPDLNDPTGWAAFVLYGI